MSSLATDETPRRPGRPRCENARVAILKATAKLLKEQPLENLAIETIAREAGVGKATIYRWWPNKGTVVIDAFLAEFAPKSAFDDAPTAAMAIERHIKRVVSVLTGPQGRVVAQIIAAGQCDADVLEHFNEAFLRTRRRTARTLLERGIASGEFDPRIDVDVALDMIYGAIWFRLLVQHLPLDADFATRLASAGIENLRAHRLRH